MGLISRVSSRTYRQKNMSISNFNMFCKMLDRALDEHSRGKTTPEYCPFETANSQLQTMQLIMSYLHPSDRKDQTMFTTPKQKEGEIEELVERFVARVTKMLNDEGSDKEETDVADQLIDLITTPSSDEVCLEFLLKIHVFCIENAGLKKFDQYNEFWGGIYSLTCKYKPELRDKLSKSLSD